MSSRSAEGGREPGELLGNLWQLLHGVLEDASPALDAMGVSVKAYFVLKAVEQHPFPAELARELMLPPPTVTYLIKQLEELGMVERRTEPGDLRKFRLVLSSVGKVAEGTGTRAMDAALAARLERISPSERAALETIVRRLVAHGV